MSDFKMKLYNFLVNKNSGIRDTYHRLHDDADRAGKIKSYAALLGLNAQYYLMGKREFDTSADLSFYEEKELKSLSESSFHNKKNELNKDKLVKSLSEYDVISFDVFDTLLLRPFSDPKDIFFFMGDKLGITDFKRIRVQQEYLARKEHERKKGDNEVTFKEIWKHIERNVGVSADEGMKLELDTEKHFCYANAFMLDVFNALKEKGKTLIAVSDMYLPSEFVKGLLEKNGFIGFEKIYMSCEYGKGKSAGDLYDVLIKDYYHAWQDKSSMPGKKSQDEGGRHFNRLSIVHIGDNEHSDIKRAREAGITAFYYPNVNAAGRSARTNDMSPIIGGAYRGVVNARLFNGLKKYSPEYEYGYVYGGILVLGYCSFIHKYCKVNGIDKLLCLSRDGEIIKQVYDFLYPGEKTEYTYISRSVVTKLMRNHNRYDFFLRFADKLINQGISIRGILAKMGVKDTSVLTKDTPGISDSAYVSYASIDTSDTLTDRNVGKFKELLNENFSNVNKALADFDKAASLYYSSVLKGSRKAAVIDIGWAGSAALSLSYLAKNVWKLNCEITGLVAGTNTLHNSEPEASEIFLQSGRLVPYAFSQSLNRDIMKKHDPNKNYNVYWELLFSSPTRQFAGFELVKDDGTGTKQERSQNTGVSERIRKRKESSCEKIIEIDGHKIRLLFGEKDYNTKGIKRIQKGILDFVHDYYSHFKDYPYMFNISGRDAAAPMLLASSHDEKYLKAIAKRFDFKIDV